MSWIVSISQLVLYGSLSILMGVFILRIVPDKYRPAFSISNRLMLGSAIAVPVMAFMPVLNIVLYIAPRLGLARSFEVVLLQYTIGLAWVTTLLVSGLLIFFYLLASSRNHMKHKGFNLLFMLLVVGMIVSIAWASHATALQFSLGIISDSIHLLAVSVWVGVVFVIAWFATNYENWGKFLSWFSVVAISCLGATAISGFLMLDVLVDDYVDAWMVSYGQGLFLKHLFLIPLIFYAVVNATYVKYKVGKDATFNPLPGVKVESMILLSIFLLTAYFTQASPPHGAYLTDSAISPLFKWLHSGEIGAASSVVFISNPIAIAFVFGCFVWIGLLIVGVWKKLPLFVQFLFAVLLVVNIYMIFMLSVGVR